MKLLPFSDSTGLSFKGESKTLNATIGANEVDFVAPFDCFLNGVDLINTEIGDSVKIFVIDVPNLIGYGANVTIDYFPKDPFYCQDKQTLFTSNYPARVKSGWKIKIVFNSISDKTVYINMPWHKVSSLGEFWL